METSKSEIKQTSNVPIVLFLWRCRHSTHCSSRSSSRVKCICLGLD